MIINSFKEQFDMLMNGVFNLPEKWVFGNYATVVQNGFFNYFFRSVNVVAISLILLLFITSFAAYPLSRLHFRFRNVIRACIVAMMAIPMHVTLIPLFKLSTDLKIYDTVFALIGPYVAFALPISTFILTGFMEQSIPKEIEEAAEIDGCGKFRAFFAIIIPLTKPALATLAIYNGVTMWNEFAFANTLTRKHAQTLPLALQAYKGENVNNIPLILSVLSLSVLPMFIMFLIMQEKLIKGMVAGAVKG
jgi:raffinose/stachyose/melibiose transport system permease protein